MTISLQKHKIVLTKNEAKMQRSSPSVMNMWHEQYCKNGVFGSSPREKELAVNAMLLSKETHFNTRQ